MGRTRLLPEHRQVSMSVAQFCALVHERQIGSETIKARRRQAQGAVEFSSVGKCGDWSLDGSGCDAACFKLAPIYLRAFPSQDENGWTSEPHYTSMCARHSASLLAVQASGTRGVSRSSWGSAGYQPHHVQDKCRNEHKVIT